jgi:hypothetical protein
MHETTRHTSFIVRYILDPDGQASGVVEHVRTGEVVRFLGLESIGRAITRLVAREIETADGAGPREDPAPRQSGRRDAHGGR